GKKNSGENIDEMLKRRTNENKMLVIGDASSKNNPSDSSQVELLKCNVHARREFIDIEDKFQEEVAQVREWYSEIYKNEAYAKKQAMGPDERLLFHQKNSGPIMDLLKEWCEKSLKEKKIEPNSQLGGAVDYILNHWPGLTGFLRIPGCPLDTNLLEGYLRTLVMNRKNWLHLKTEYGALINDIHVSVIKSCEASGENIYTYLNVLQNNEASVRVSPEKWLPWNYKENLPKDTTTFTA
ncbi:MAG: transposase, partial [Oligoflexia bacterium]|nr:transposase [Oligoflexia bacterium]